MATQAPSKRCKGTQKRKSVNATAQRSAAVIQATEDPTGLALGHKVPSVLGDLVARLARPIVVAAGGTSAIEVWDVATGARLHTLPHGGFAVGDCFLAENGTRLFATVATSEANDVQFET